MAAIRLFRGRATPKFKGFSPITTVHNPTRLDKNCRRIVHRQTDRETDADHYTTFLAKTGGTLTILRRWVTLRLNFRLKGDVSYQYAWTVRWGIVILQLCRGKFLHKETL